MPPKTPNHEWIRHKLDTLTDFADELYEINPDAVNEIGPWAPLKLFQLTVTLDMYTRVIQSTPNIDRKIYFDVLAGSGVVSLDNEDTNIIGSPLIAAILPEHSFDELHFFEYDSDRAKALSKRLDYISFNTSIDLDRDACQVHEGDANKNVKKVVEDIRSNGGYRGTNQLSFVDNERMEINWDTMVTLSKIWGDYLINFQHKGVSRELGYLNSGNTTPARVETAHETLYEFVGSDQYKQCTNASELKNLYKIRLGQIGEEYNKRKNNRPIQEEIRVRGAGGKYSYDMIYATRETSNGSPYVKVMNNMKSRIESMSGGDVSQIIDIMDGGATNLDQFIPTKSELELDEGQRSLDSF